MSQELVLVEPIEIQTFVGHNIVVPTVTKNSIHHALISNDSAVLLPCISFFSAGTAQVGMRNNCSECKRAVVMWSGVGIYKYQIAGYQQIVVNVVSQNGQLIGEEPC